MPSFGEVLEQMNLSMNEFIICAGFWVAMFIVSSFISLNNVLSECSHTSSSPHAFLSSAPQIFLDYPATLTRRAVNHSPAGFPPIAMTLSGLQIVSSAMPTIMAVAAMGLLLFGLFKYRELVGKSVIFILRKVTRLGGKR